MLCSNQLSYITQQPSIIRGLDWSVKAPGKLGNRFFQYDDNGIVARAAAHVTRGCARKDVDRSAAKSARRDRRKHRAGRIGREAIDHDALGHRAQPGELAFG
jgi:hypothetical protein